jgi:hypothetical protein
MNRIVKLHVNDLLVDAKQAGAVIDAACHSHQAKMQATCLCQLDDIIIIPLEESEDRGQYSYIFSKLPSLSEDDLIAEINTRYAAGFVTLGICRIKDDLWGFFARDNNFNK